MYPPWWACKGGNLTGRWQIVSRLVITLVTTYLIYVSYSLQEILSYLSERAKTVISNGHFPPQFGFLLKFLAAWEERPSCLTPIAYDLCSIISQARGPVLGCSIPSPHLLTPYTPYLWNFGEEDVEDLLLTAFRIGFRLVGPDSDHSTLRLGDTPPDAKIFKIAFSSSDDEAIADAACVWIADNINIPPVSFSRSFSQRVGRTTPFSPRLRWVCVRAIPSVLHRELGTAGLETVRLLNRLKIDEDDMIAGSNSEWAKVLVSVIRSQVGPRNLSFHYWCLLERLLSDPQDCDGFIHRDVEVVEFLEKAGEWKKLEVWMAVVWRSLLFSGTGTPTSMVDIERVTLELLFQIPSALPRFRDLSQILPAPSRSRSPYQMPSAPSRPRSPYQIPSAPPRPRSPYQVPSAPPRPRSPYQIPSTPSRFRDLSEIPHRSDLMIYSNLQTLKRICDQAGAGQSPPSESPPQP